MDTPMTPEERFTRIENFLNTVAEHQAQMSENLLRHDTDILELREIQKGMALAITKVADAQKITEQSLKALTKKMDRIIGKEDSTPS